MITYDTWIEEVRIVEVKTTKNSRIYTKLWMILRKSWIEISSDIFNTEEMATIRVRGKIMVFPTRSYQAEQNNSDQPNIYHENRMKLEKCF